MKRILSLLLTVLMLGSVLTGCGGTRPAGNVYNDGRARPSSCGKLQVKNGKLCSESGDPSCSGASA